MDDADLSAMVLAAFEQSRIAYCVIGGQAVNAYVDPLVSLDLDIAVASANVDSVIAALPAAVRVERFSHSINLSAQDSQLRVQLQLDPRYRSFPERASVREVLGRQMRVAAAEDVLDGKIWAASDRERRPSKRQKDLADIARLIEKFPALRSRVPPGVLDRLV